METTPRFITGVFPFAGKGLEVPSRIGQGYSYTVPSGKRAQLIYFRAGNSCNEMVSVFLIRNEKPLRIFPIGAKGAMHVPLAVVEDLEPDTVIEVRIAAPKGVSGQIVLDIGLVEI